MSTSRKKKNFLSRALDSKDSGVELYALLGAFALLMFVVYVGYDLMVLHTPFNGISYGTGLGGILVAINSAGLLQSHSRRIEQAAENQTAEQTQS